MRVTAPAAEVEWNVVAPMDRRKFLTGSAKAAAAVAAVGAGGSLLAACGGSSGGSKKSANNTPSTNAANIGISSETPRAGGTLKMGMWSEIDGFDPAANHWDATGLIYAHTIYDALGILMDDGTVAPYLAKSIEHNADYTVWTITARDGIKFHDGEAFDGAAIVANVTTMQKSALAGPALLNLKSAAVSPSDPQAAVLTMHESWVPFDTYLTGAIGGQMAYMVSPAAIKKGNVSTQPVGTGPFIFVEWKPNDHLSVKKNPTYWQQGKPHLDAIEFRPIADSQSRENAFKAGDVDIIMATSADNVLDFKADKNVDFLTNTMVKVIGEPSPVFFQVNCVSEPLKDVRLRQALAYATDQAKLVKVAEKGVGEYPVSGPWPKGNVYHTDTGYPTTPDTAKAKQLVDAWSKDNGGKKPAFHVGSTPDPSTLQLVTLAQAMWNAVGFDVQIDQVEQAQYITKALVGDYDCYIWTQFACPDPDANYIWWSTLTVGKVGALSLNFARNSDEEIQKQLEIGRTSTDQTKRVAAYQEISKLFAKDLPYIWIYFPESGIASSPKVQNWAKTQTPEGKPAANIFSNQSPYTVEWWLKA
jgi:ABC-type transport system substrate-binding protein